MATSLDPPSSSPLADRAAYMQILHRRLALLLLEGEYAPSICAGTYARCVQTRRVESRKLALSAQKSRAKCSLVGTSELRARRLRV